jgi:rod shape-determining protein MreD
MTDHNYAFGRILVTIIISLCLRIAPWQGDMALLNPDWTLLALIYWTLAIPERIGIFHAWGLGILTDVLTGQLFGQYALSYSIASYMCLKRHKRLRQFPLLQQALFIFICLFLSQALLFLIKNLHSPAQLHVIFWLPTIIGTLCWPLVYNVLRYIRLFHLR